MKVWKHLSRKMTSVNNKMSHGVFLTAVFVFLSVLDTVFGEAHCSKRRFDGLQYKDGFVKPINYNLRCDTYYQWTVSEFCCYDNYDTGFNRPYCCHSETYKLLVAVGIICAMVLGASLFMFLCWCYNIPHLILRVLTCGKFSLNDYMKKTKMTGPYVDPSFYAGEPFWTSEGSEFSHYPLRPMPPRIFYPVPAKMDLRRWSNQRQYNNGQTPLFVLASRQFTRNPYSARPNDRGSASSSISGPSGMTDGGGVNSSRRSSTSSCAHYDAHRIHQSSFGFKVHIDEVDAASELLEALKYLDEKDKNFSIPKVKEETEFDLDNDNKTGTELQIESRRYPTHQHSRHVNQVTQTSSPVVAAIHKATPPAPPPPPMQLDVTKLSGIQSQRTLSGTSFRRHMARGSSIDSAPSSTSTLLESISEERSALRSINTFQNDTGSPPYSNSLLPGYIPEEIEPDLQDKARKSISTA